MRWNYRIIKKYYPESDDSEFNVHEVYYDENNDIETWTQNPISCSGYNLSELREDIRYHLTAFSKPILTEVDGKLVSDEDEVVINDGHYSHALDRVSVAIDYLNNAVGANPVIRRQENTKALFEVIDEKMAELYIALGELMIEKEYPE